MGERMVVQFARGARKREDAPSYHERSAPRPRRTTFRMSITNLPVETSWQVSIPISFWNLRSHIVVLMPVPSCIPVTFVPILCVRHHGMPSSGTHDF